MDKKDKMIVSILSAIEKRAQGYKVQVEEKYQAELENLQTFFSKKIDSLSTDDLAEQPLSKLTRIIEAIDLTPEDFRNVDLETEEGRVQLLNAINGFIKVYTDRIDHAIRGVERCEKYADLITSKKFNIPFKDINDFNNFFNTLGISDKEKVYVQKLLAEKNIASVKLDPEITQHVTYMHEYQEDNEDVKQSILESFEGDRRISMTSFKQFCKMVSEKCNHSIELVENVLISMILGQEYGKFLRDGKADSLKHINEFAKLEYTSKQIIIAEANRIISREMINIRHPEFESIEDIVVTAAQDEIDFEHRKVIKMSMIAYMLKDKVEEYINCRLPGLEDQYKEVIIGLCEEYRNTEGLVYVPVEQKIK